MCNVRLINVCSYACIYNCFLCVYVANSCEPPNCPVKIPRCRQFLSQIVYKNLAVKGGGSTERAFPAYGETGKTGLLSSFVIISSRNYTVLSKRASPLTFITLEILMSSLQWYLEVQDRKQARRTDCHDLCFVLRAPILYPWSVAYFGPLS